MNNVQNITDTGICTGCGACNVCENITFVNGPLGFPMPKISENCTGCGKCLSLCIYDPNREEN